MPEIIYGNRYRLDAKIGEGGMAIVHRGYDLILRRQVAVKVLRPQFSADATFIERFEFEAQAAAKLSHPNIVTTYDVGQVNGDHYIVEEYVPGETLAVLIKRQGRLPESAAVRYARQISAALAAAHRHELLHGDIKPSNILITREDVVRITDFGIARALDQGDREADEIVLGSLPYAAPEALRGMPASERSDLYSLGIVLFEMVTGRRPFEAPTNDALAAAIVELPPPDIDAAGATVSPALRAIIAKLLRKTPEQRYRSAGEVLAALRHIARGHTDEEPESESAGPDAPTEILRRRARPAFETAVRLPPGPETPVWRGGHVIGIAAGFVGLLVVLALIVAASQASSRSMRLPDLTNKSVAEAVATLHSLGVNDITIKQQPDPAVQGGLVDGTDPTVGTRVGPGNAVTLLVSNGPPTVEVPNVLGEDPKNAQEFLAASGFTVREGKRVHSATVRQGLVAATNPAPGSPLGKGGIVVVSVSLGPDLVQVPNIVAMTEDDARKLLAHLGLKLAVNSQVAVSNIPANVILSQEPSERSTLAPGSTVMVDVSAGPAAIEVPQVVGMTLDAARTALEGAGLAVGSVVQAAMPDQPPGTVVSQTPGSFARVSAGTAVDLVVSTGGQAAPASPSANPGNPLPPIPNVIGMTVDQAKGELERNGYHVDRVTVLPGSPADARVLSTDPAVGTTPPPGSTSVNLIIGK